tara:strand:- start:163 stop:552 length:390 start_codon:yes stop_codon:yes gene_type:complete
MIELPKLRTLAACTFLATFVLSAPVKADERSHAQILDTPNYSIRIEVRCPEGEVTCDNVVYRGESKRTKKSIRLVGSTAHSMCADGVTPCRFLGYVFRNDAFTYFVNGGGELVVLDGDTVVVSEQGVWK